MKVENLVGITFNEEEVKEALLMLMDCEMNDLLHTDPKHQRLSKLINHVRNNISSLDWVDSDMYMSLDGVCDTEEL